MNGSPLAPSGTTFLAEARTMSERERERLYWRVCCALLAASPLVAYLLARSRVALGLESLYFAAALAASVPLPIALEMALQLARGRLPRVWLESPTVRVEHRARGEVGDAVEAVRARLGGLGFVSEVAGDGPVDVEFARARSPRVHAIMDHAFAGTARVAGTPYGPRIEADLTLLDTLLVESGELAAVEELAGYIVGRRAELDLATLPFTMCCAACLSWVAAGLTAAAGLGLGPGPAWAASASAAAVALSLVMLVVVARDRERLLGLRVGLASVALVAAPWCARLAAEIAAGRFLEGAGL